MAQLTALIVSHDEDFRRNSSSMLRGGGVPIGILEEARTGAAGTEPDVALIDLRGDAAGGLAAIERLRAAHPTTAIFAIAGTTDPELILQAMRAGANEFFTWPPQQDAFYGALRRTAARRETAQAAARQPSATLVFFGAKGG
ncbi:MAG TPA: response regulator, partial [Vicinamibacterales bacterium]